MSVMSLMVLRRRSSFLSTLVGVTFFFGDVSSLYAPASRLYHSYDSESLLNGDVGYTLGELEERCGRPIDTGDLAQCLEEAAVEDGIYGTVRIVPEVNTRGE